MANVEFLDTIPDINDRRLEIVERKGIGHPDTLADGAAEAISNAWSRHTLETYGGVLNHNVDKLYITGGLVEVDFGSGQVTQPARLFVGGRMTTTFGGQPTGAYELAERTAMDYVHGILPHAKPGEFVSTVLTNDYSHNPYHYHPRDIHDVPNVHDPRANDTSTTVGYWPPSPTEKLTLDLEGFFYGSDGKPRFDHVGQDIKVMSKRIDGKVDSTVRLPQLGQHVNSFDDYYDFNRKIEQELNEYAAERLARMGSTLRSLVQVNPNTDQQRQPYLLFNGSCTEAGEEGFPGRGNKLHGVISNVRPISMEAPHGKNPQYFVGKIGMYFATEIARYLSEGHDNATVHVYTSSNKGEPIRYPYLTAVEASVPIGGRAIQQAVETVTQGDYLTALTSGYFMPKVHYYNNNM